jgi:hemerythrin-like metal-binding protein
VAEIDAQHQTLIETINQLIRAREQGDDPEVVGTTLMRLVSYLEEHFAAEERLMQELGDPGFEEHRSEHQQFVSRTLEFVRGQREGRQHLSDDMLCFLQRWLINHILGTDRKYVPLFRKHGLR